MVDCGTLTVTDGGDDGGGQPPGDGNGDGDGGDGGDGGIDLPFGLTRDQLLAGGALAGLTIGVIGLSRDDDRRRPPPRRAPSPRRQSRGGRQ